MERIIGMGVRTERERERELMFSSYSNLAFHDDSVQTNFLSALHLQYNKLFANGCRKNGKLKKISVCIVVVAFVHYLLDSIMVEKGNCET